MSSEQRWGVAYLGPRAGQVAGRQRIVEVLEAAFRWAPLERTLVVVQESERPWWTIVTESMPAANVLAEPFDRGTGTGVIAALLTVADRAPAAEVAVVYGPVSRPAMAAATESVMDTGCPDSGLVSFRMSVSESVLPFVVGRVQAWLQKAESADRARVSALRSALASAAHPTTALDHLYPFLTALDFEQALLDPARYPPRIVQAIAEPSDNKRPSRSSRLRLDPGAARWSVHS